MSLPRPPHVLFVTGEYPPTPGGIGDYTACLSTELGRQAVHCTVVTTRGDEARSTQRVLRTVRDWGWRALPVLRALIRDLSPDVVHIQYQTGAYGMHPAISLLPVLLRPLPVAVTFHDLKEPYLFPKAGPARRLPNQLLLRSAASAIVTNGQDAHALADRDIAEIPIGSNVQPIWIAAADRGALRDRFGVSDRELVVGHFGFVNEWKGVDTLLDAIALLRARGIDVRLMFVGGTRRPGAADSYGFESEIRRRAPVDAIWTGFAEPAEVSALLQTIDVCALPYTQGASLRHGTLAAAMAHHLPIVTTRPGSESGALPRLVDRENAILIDPGEPSQLADAIVELRADPPLRRAIAEGAAHIARSHEWHEIAAAHRRLYAGLLGWPSEETALPRLVAV